MLRLLYNEFEEGYAKLESGEHQEEISLATAKLAYPYLERMAKKMEEKYEGLKVHTYCIRNDFFGERSTVSGLITGQDLIKQLKDQPQGSRLLIPSNILKKDGSQNTLFGLLFEGNQNCCLIETAPQIPVTPATPRPEPEIHKTVDMFEDDQELKEQARLARLKKEEEEKEARAAAKEAERLRKQKEKEEKERRKREAGPSWIQRKIDSLTKEIFSDDDMK